MEMLRQVVTLTHPYQSRNAKVSKLRSLHQPCPGICCLRGGTRCHQGSRRVHLPISSYQEREKLSTLMTTRERHSTTSHAPEF